MIRLTHEPIDAGKLIEAVNRPDCGAIVTFLGTVRDVTGDQHTAALEYEAYPELAETVLNKIKSAAMRKWPIQAIAIIHRLGLLQPAESSVGVAVACPHRADAFEACKFVIDHLKAEAPIWKREHSPDGSARWVHPGVTS